MLRRFAIPCYRDDEHGTPSGHKLAAEAIRRYLQSAKSQ